MTCVWDAILSMLKKQGSNPFINPCPEFNSFQPLQLVEYLQLHNTICSNTRWNKTELKQRLLQENFMHVKLFNTDSIPNGYACSVSDPFLCLFSFLTRRPVELMFDGVAVCLDTAQYSNNSPWKFACNQHHFWAV